MLYKQGMVSAFLGPIQHVVARVKVDKCLNHCEENFHATFYTIHQSATLNWFSDGGFQKSIIFRSSITYAHFYWYFIHFWGFVRCPNPLNVQHFQSLSMAVKKKNLQLKLIE